MFANGQAIHNGWCCNDRDPSQTEPWQFRVMKSIQRPGR